MLLELNEAILTNLRYVGLDGGADANDPLAWLGFSPQKTFRTPIAHTLARPARVRGGRAPLDGRFGGCRPDFSFNMGWGRVARPPNEFHERTST